MGFHTAEHVERLDKLFDEAKTGSLRRLDGDTAAMAGTGAAAYRAAGVPTKNENVIRLEHYPGGPPCSRSPSPAVCVGAQSL